MAVAQPQVKWRPSIRRVPLTTAINNTLPDIVNNDAINTTRFRSPDNAGTHVDKKRILKGCDQEILAQLGLMIPNIGY